MQISLSLTDRSLEYTIRRSRRAKRARLTVYGGGAVILTLPQRASLDSAERFVRAKTHWIFKTLGRLAQTEKIMLPRSGVAAERAHWAAAARLVEARLGYFNAIYGFAYSSVAIRDQRTRWGSCSDRGRLSFNYRLIFLPLSLADYVIVHELCHLRELHHQPRFWALVARTLPDYLERRRALRGYALPSGPR